MCVFVRSEARVEQHIDRDNLSVPVDVVTNLPANAATWPDDSDGLVDYFLLRCDVLGNC